VEIEPLLLEPFFARIGTGVSAPLNERYTGHREEDTSRPFIAMVALNLIENAVKYTSARRKASSR
jgi:hypothetical protein